MPTRQAEPGRREAVVFIHGIWFGGLFLWPLRRAIARCGYHCRQFNYWPVFRDASEVSAQLSDYLRKIDANTIHIVCHSLGGLTLRHFLNIYCERRLGRVVFMGVPSAGSHVGAILARHAWGRLALGKAVDYGLLGDAPPWPPKLPLGILAGTRSFGAGRLFPGVPRPNDGTVSVTETHLDGASAHLCLPVTHTGMLYSHRVIQPICRFLEYGRFEL